MLHYARIDLVCMYKINYPTSPLPEFFNGTSCIYLNIVHTDTLTVQYFWCSEWSGADLTRQLNEKLALKNTIQLAGNKQ